MEEIYLKIRMTEEYLRDLRLSLESAEKEYEAHGPAVGRPSVLASRTKPFLDSAYASAKAAALSGGVKMR
jgi:hypothetical protein